MNLKFIATKIEQLTAYVTNALWFPRREKWYQYMWLGYWAQECGLSSSPRSRESQKRDGTPLHVYGISLARYTSEKLRRIGLSRVSVSATESSTRISMKKIVMRISSASYTQSLTTRQCLVCFCGSAADYGR